MLPQYFFPRKINYSSIYVHNEDTRRWFGLPENLIVTVIFLFTMESTYLKMFQQIAAKAYKRKAGEHIALE